MVRVTTLRLQDLEHFETESWYGTCDDFMATRLRARQTAGMVRVTTLRLQDLEQDRRLVWYV